MLRAWALLFLGVMAWAGSAMGEELLAHVSERFTGDFEAMVARRTIRVLVPPSKTFYFQDRGRQMGFTYEGVRLFEQHVNERLKIQHAKIKVIIIPTRRDRLLSDLVAGRGDIAAGNLTVTKARQEMVDFADALYSNVNEVVVTSDRKQSLASIFDLAGREVHVRKSSSYYESLSRLNAALAEVGKQQVSIRPVDEYLEDEDLLEMVNAEMISMIVMDDHKAHFWARIFPDIKVHDQVKLRRDGKIAWAIRKDSPQLMKVINAFVARNKAGSLNFNILKKRYFENIEYVNKAATEEELAKFRQTLKLFQKYGQMYSFDFLMLAAMGYQESKLDHRKRSKAGAVGIMQILPSTAADPNVAIRNVEKIENNIHAGAKYLRFMMDRYFVDDDVDELNRRLFAFASYNAGPAKIDLLRKATAAAGLDANLWFNNVELIAAQRIGRETVQYVSNIYKYYIAYKMIMQAEQLKKIGEASVAVPRAE